MCFFNCEKIAGTFFLADEVATNESKDVGYYMLLAEINNKLSHSSSYMERMEDILTSNIFGVFKYLDDRTVMLQFLRSAVTVEDQTLVISSVDHFEFYFWPVLENGREPDLLIRGYFKEELKYDILIEMKYLSGKSNIFLDNQKVIRDQLVEEYSGLLTGRWKDQIINLKKPNQSLLIYITSNYQIPLRDIQESIDKLQKTEDLEHQPKITGQVCVSFTR